MDRCVGPSWFRNRFPVATPSAAAMSNSIWEAFLTLTLLSIHIVTDGFSFMGYQPNLVATKYGFSQMSPSLLYTWKDDIFWSERKFTTQEYIYCLVFTSQQVLGPTFHFQSSFYLTVEFNNWWTNYFQSHFSKENFRKRLSAALSNLQDNPEKKNVHINHLFKLFSFIPSTSHTFSL